MLYVSQTYWKTYGAIGNRSHFEHQLQWDSNTRIKTRSIMDSLSGNKALSDLDLLPSPALLQLHLQLEVPEGASQGIPNTIPMQVQSRVEKLFNSSLNKRWTQLLVSGHNIPDGCSCCKPSSPPHRLSHSPIGQFGPRGQAYPPML